jgi:molecular chaperone GrpE
MANEPDKPESAADRAIREALESVERMERERDAEDSFDPDAVEAVDAGAADADADAPAPRRSSSDAMLEAVLKAKGELQEVLAQTQKEAKDMFDRLTRVSADFENFKKRQSREKQDAIKFANEGVFKELLPVVDNLQRAVQAAGGAPGDKLSDGVKLVLKQFEDTMTKFGVTGFDSHAAPFDPARHEAVGARPHDDIPANHVAEEFQRGYLLHERLLRPALVIVSSGPASGDGTSDPSTN